MTQELIDLCNMIDVVTVPLGLQATVEKVLPHGVTVCLSGPERRSKHVFIATNLLMDTLANERLSPELMKHLKEDLRGEKAS